MSQQSTSWTETPGMKLVLLFLTITANVLLGLALVMLGDVRDSNKELSARMNQLELRMATDYVRKDDLRSIVSGVIETAKQDKL